MASPATLLLLRRRVLSLGSAAAARDDVVVVGEAEGDEAAAAVAAVAAMLGWRGCWFGGAAELPPGLDRLGLLLPLLRAPESGGTGPGPGPGPWLVLLVVLLLLISRWLWRLLLPRSLRLPWLAYAGPEEDSCSRRPGVVELASLLLASSCSGSMSMMNLRAAMTGSSRRDET
jgi:hypothetical protein